MASLSIVRVFNSFCRQISWLKLSSSLMTDIYASNHTQHTIITAHIKTRKRGHYGYNVGVQKPLYLCRWSVRQKPRGVGAGRRCQLDKSLRKQLACPKR